ncbi:hypothetical protein [Mucilaginibacter paludis]|uniref:Restriction endonuclease n=1 Tax=Mucilaginibacter paludis DSM 18603 TaxID=714943 RepID=H1Y259_9SPHI|nr:hypothetical protein [Mucilaginibacter paludis]EHQ26716.1 hypothetical protein Mucpa_2601 [Mucilaginibacter paludis DSM 18603]
MLKNDQLQSVLSTAIEIAQAENADHILPLLTKAELSIEQTGYNNWNNGTDYFTIFVTVDVKSYVSVKSNLKAIEDDLLQRFTETIRRSESEELVQVNIIPRASSTIPEMNVHRPLSEAELERKALLIGYLNQASEDDLIGEILMPLFRYMGFQRITIAGHKDKALEYGKDIWMRYVLPTQNVLYFGIQAKKGKLDSAGMGKPGNANIAEIHNQVTMMLGHEVFDHELGRTALVDHAFIIAGGEITKHAKNWIAHELDRSKRSQIMFMDREDILNLFIVNGISLPPAAFPPIKDNSADDLPF